MKNEMGYMKKHAPRCLGGKIRTAPDSLRNFLQDKLGDNSTVFSPICECLNAFITIASSADLSPTSISCPKCGRTRVVFDPTKHGYDGELGNNDGLEMAPMEQIRCPKCNGNIFQLSLCFQYSGETDILEDDDPPDIKPEDLFGWVMIAAQCENCKALQEVSQQECA